MAQKFALNRLLEIAATSAESAAAHLGALNRQLQKHEEKLLLLFKYRDEYQQRLRSASGLDGAALRNFHDFLDRLEQAILQQHALVVDARTRAEAGRNEWQLKQRKSKAFGTLAQRFDLVTQRKEAGREQKLQDDFASRTNRGEHRAHGLASAASTKDRR
jgi:flagellar FliJ protein